MNPNTEPELYAKIFAHDRDVLGCLANAAARNLEFEGHIVADLEVQPDGSAKTNIVSATVPLDDELQRCLRLTVALWRLPRPRTSDRAVAGVTWLWESAVHVGCQPPADLPPGNVWGCVDKNIVRKVIGTHHRIVAACVDASIAQNPSLAGTVQVQFTIERKGHVGEARVANSDVHDASLESCLLRDVQNWRFPPPMGGGMVVITYPFVFKTKR